MFERIFVFDTKYPCLPIAHAAHDRIIRESGSNKSACNMVLSTKVKSRAVGPAKATESRLEQTAEASREIGGGRRRKFMTVMKGIFCNL